VGAERLLVLAGQEHKRELEQWMEAYEQMEADRDKVRHPPPFPILLLCVCGSTLSSAVVLSYFTVEEEGG
jgi:hypothetical protein